MSAACVSPPIRASAADDAAVGQAGSAGGVTTSSAVAAAATSPAFALTAHVIPAPKLHTATRAANTGDGDRRSPRAGRRRPCQRDAGDEAERAAWAVLQRHRTGDGCGACRGDGRVRTNPVQRYAGHQQDAQHAADDRAHVGHRRSQGQALHHRSILTRPPGVLACATESGRDIVQWTRGSGRTHPAVGSWRGEGDHHAARRERPTTRGARRCVPRSPTTCWR